MKAVSLEPVTVRSDGKQVVQALLVSDNTPTTLPTTGENIEGMSANMVFAPFSVLYVVADAATKIYMANESGAFVAQ